MSKISGKLKELVCLILAICILLTAVLYHEDESGIFEVDGHSVIKNENVELNYIQPYGEMPDKFSEIVANDMLNSAIAGNDCYFRYAVSGSDILVEKYSLNFEKQLTFRVDSTVSDGIIKSIISTSDGGMLCSVGSGEYQQDGIWHKAELSIMKYNNSGQLEWECELEEYTDSAAGYLYETDGGYCAVGHTETPATDVEGVYSPNDVCIIRLDRSGNITAKKLCGGSDFDSLSSCYKVDGEYELLISTQSKDGTFKASSDGYPVKIKVKLDEHFDVVSFENTNFTDSEFIGTLDGQAVLYAEVFIEQGDNCSYERRLCLADGRELPYTDTCDPEILIDCGEYYLLMSSHTVGELEYQYAAMSSLWYYTQNVYEAYDKSGNLLWRACVDSTPKEQREFVEKCRESDPKNK